VLPALPALVVFGVFLNYYAGFVSDDAFISFRYAEHLATGRGLEWNPGYRVEGYTNFLWVAATALLRLAGLAVPAAARVLSWVSAGLIVVLIVAAARRESDRPSRTLLALSPLPVALSFSFQYWTALRLETTLFAMLLLAAPLLFVLEEERHRGPRWPSALAYLALALTRPEGAVFIAVPGIYLLSRVRSLDRLRLVWRERWLWLVVFAGGMALYTLWRVIYFGHLMPNTYYAKVGGEGLLTKGWEYVARFVDQRPHTLFMALGALLLGGTASRMCKLLLGTMLILGAVVFLEGGDWMREFRLLQPLTPLAAAALAVSLQRALAERARCFPDGGEGRGRLAAVAGMLLLCAYTQGNIGTPLAEWGAAWRLQPRDVLINLEGEMTVASRDVGLWLRRVARADELVAVNHAGAVPFYSDLPTVDMAGLNDLHLARLQGARHSKWDAAYVLGRKPAFIVLNTRNAPRDGVYTPGYWGGETAVVQHPDFARHYRAVPKVWSWRHRSLDSRGWPGHATAFIMVFRRQ
jgi:arabinofuranosyltransferase